MSRYVGKTKITHVQEPSISLTTSPREMEALWMRMKSTTSILLVIQMHAHSVDGNEINNKHSPGDPK